MIMPMHLIVLGGTEPDITSYLAYRHADLQHGWYGEPGGELYEALHDRVVAPGRLDVGEMSWIDTEESSPPPLLELTKLLHQAPEIDAALIVDVHMALSKPTADLGYDIADADLVASWLGEHIGERVFYEIS